MRSPRLVQAAGVLGTAALALVIGQPAPAWADEPTRQAETLHRNIAAFVTCPYGALSASFDLTRVFTTFTRDGVPVKRIMHGYGSGSITNPATGQSLDATVNRVLVWDLTDGSLFTTGTNVLVKLPTGGTSLAGAGRLVFDSTGTQVDHDGPDVATEFSQLCDALAP